ncbi:family 10 glycosylhydrolase [Auraticoccus sp. F435]|uniref:Family 10 glycosylhydrolase n=1 Tax=Auraticoccus cholistanensis TaxID=2656650 RepID=A0A6A9URS7_9ACTN|nr:family 10 glycosylhydrolase [Auraticoccus cholistanensis]
MTALKPESPWADRSPDWYRSATRWTQLTFTDDDPAVLDVDFWLDVMRRSRSNALCLSAGGYMAFYPTDIPFHHRSAHLGDSDPFGALVEGARSLGMHVMARVDPHAVHADAAEAHPEWLARDVEGRPIPHASQPGVWLTDPCSSYHRDYMTDVAREIVTRYDVDAVFANRWEGHGGVSYAEETARAFLADTGHRLPRADVPDDPAWPVYAAWRSRRLSELVVRWDDAVREIRPHVRFIPNRGAMLTRDLVREMVDDRYPMFFVDKQGRSGTEAAWTPGRIGKRTRGLFPDRPVCLITSVGPESPLLRWKDSVADGHELRTWIVDGFAQGAQPWFTKFKAECFDTRWIQPVVDAYLLHERCEPLFSRLPVTAEVALLDTKTGSSTNPWASHGAPSSHEDGFYHALVEARIPFEYVADEKLSLQRLEGIRVLVLPHAAELTAQQVAVVEAFVAAGGSLVAAFDSGLPPTTATDRASLAGLLGVRVVEDVRGPVKNNYISLCGEHPVNRGFEGAQRIVGGTRLLGVEAADDAEVVFRFVPDYPDLPMEEVYPRPGTARPAVVARTHPSGGRTVHLAFDIGHIYWDALQSDHGRLIANAVGWALGEQGAGVRVEGAGLVDVAVRTGTDEVAVAVVNLTNPMAMRGQNRETIPLPPQTVSVRLPDGVRTAEAELVVAGTPAPVEVVDGFARVRVEGVELLEVVHLRWVTA